MAKISRILTPGQMTEAGALISVTLGRKLESSENQRCSNGGPPVAMGAVLKMEKNIFTGIFLTRPPAIPRTAVCSQSPKLEPKSNH